jgi:hypothetical protein
MDKELQRLLQLAGIKSGESKYAVLLPALPGQEMRALLDKLKSIADDESVWNEVDIEGEKYIATGVSRDLT